MSGHWTNKTIEIVRLRNNHFVGWRNGEFFETADMFEAESMSGYDIKDAFESMRRCNLNTDGAMVVEAEYTAILTGTIISGIPDLKTTVVDTSIKKQTETVSKPRSADEWESA